LDVDVEGTFKVLLGELFGSTYINEYCIGKVLVGGVNGRWP
jgi:hypothetical protein